MKYKIGDRVYYMGKKRVISGLWSKGDWYLLTLVGIHGIISSANVKPIVRYHPTEANFYNCTFKK